MWEVRPKQGQVLKVGAGSGEHAIDGRPTAPSNAAFDASSKATDPRFGVRDVAAVSQESARSGLALKAQIRMLAKPTPIVPRTVARWDGVT